MQYGIQFLWIGLFVLYFVVVKTIKVDFYGKEYNDSIIENNDDSGFGLIDLGEKGLDFLSINEKKLYVNVNGVLSFEYSYSNYIPATFPVEERLILVYNGDVDLRGSFPDYTSEGNLMFYRNSSDVEEIEHFLNQIPLNIRKETFNPDMLYVVTWENVGYYDQKVDLLNTFQVVLLADSISRQTYLIYNYEKLEWVTAETHELYGPAVGFCSIAGYFEFSSSRSMDINRRLTTSSNVGVAGRFVYQVDKFINCEKNSYFQSKFTLNVCAVSRPMQKIEVKQISTESVPGRIIDNYIVIRNNEGTENIVDVTEHLDPWSTYIDSNPEQSNFTTRNENILNSRIEWNGIIILPFETKVIFFRTYLHPNLPLGLEVGGL